MKPQLKIDIPILIFRNFTTKMSWAYKYIRLRVIVACSNIENNAEIKCHSISKSQLSTCICTTLKSYLLCFVLKNSVGNYIQQNSIWKYVCMCMKLSLYNTHRLIYAWIIKVTSLCIKLLTIIISESCNEKEGWGKGTSL